MSLFNQYTRSYAHSTRKGSTRNLVGREIVLLVLVLIFVLLTMTLNVASAARHDVGLRRTTGILAETEIRKLAPHVTVTATLPAQPIVARQENVHRNAEMQGPYRVQGNVILAADGQPYLFHGVARDDLEYECAGDGHYTADELAYMGSGTNTATATYWGANTVRLPLSEGFWLRGQPSQNCSVASYQALVQKTVDTLTALNLNVILDLHWSDAGGQSLQGGGQWAMPDSDSIIFWQQVASLYKNYTNVLFELYNEPHPTEWACWAVRCTIANDVGLSNDCGCFKTATYTGVGMQALVDAVRNTGTTNLVLVGGVNWGYDLSQLPRYALRGTNIVYVTHPYNSAGREPATWNGAFGAVSTGYPVLSTESGEFYCGTNYVSALLSYFDAHQIGWLGWAWTAQGDICSYPRLILNYEGKPTPGLGELVYQHLHKYL